MCDRFVIDLWNRFQFEVLPVFPRYLPILLRNTGTVAGSAARQLDSPPTALAVEQGVFETRRLPNFVKSKL